MISVAHLSPAPQEEDPFHRKPPPPGPVEDSQEDSGLEDGERFEVEVVLNHKKVRNAYKYLIKWKDLDHQHDVWKTEFQLRHSQDLIEEHWLRKGGRPTLALANVTAKEANATTKEASGAPKKRGRPRKTPITTTNGASEAPTRKRGRPRKAIAAAEIPAPDIPDIPELIAPTIVVAPSPPATLGPESEPASPVPIHVEPEPEKASRRSERLRK